MDQLTLIQSLRRYGSDFISHPVSRGIADIEAAGELMLEAARALAEPADQPVAAQHRFRHPQEGMPGWSVWQPCKVAQRPPWEIDSQGYEVEYRALYTAPQPAKRVELTDEEVTAHFREHIATGSLLSFADGVRFAERAHGITKEGS